MENQQIKLIRDSVSPVVSIITLLRIISNLEKNNTEFQNLSDEEIKSISEQSSNLALEILNNISKTQPYVSDINELKKFIRDEVEKIYNNPNIVESSEYSNYVIKPNKETLLYYVILLSDDDLLFNLYFNWLSIKKICNLLINIYKQNLDKTNNFEFLNFLISVNDLFNKFSSPEIIELQENEQHGGMIFATSLAILSALVYINTGSAFIMVDGFSSTAVHPIVDTVVRPMVDTAVRPIVDTARSGVNKIYDSNNLPIREEITQELIQGPSIETDDWYDKTKQFLKSKYTSNELFLINWSLDRLSEEFGVSSEERQKEGNRALTAATGVVNSLAYISKYDMVRGVSLIAGYAVSPLKGIFGEDRTNFASTKIVNRMYELGLSSGDVFRLIYTLESIFDVVVPYYEKQVELVKSKQHISPNAIQKMQKDVVNILKSKVTNISLDALLSIAGLSNLKGLKDLLIMVIPNPSENLEENLKMLKESQSDIKTGKTAIITLLKNLNEGDIAEQKIIKKDYDKYYEIPDWAFLGGKKTKKTKKTIKKRSKKSRNKKSRNKKSRNKKSRKY